MSEILMPQLGEPMAEGRLLKWHIRVGSKVRPGDVIAEVETDKANMDIEATEAGTIIEVRVAAGAVVPVGSVMAVYAPHGEPLTRSLATAGARPAAPAPVPAPANASPLAARLAQTRGIDLARVKGTGPGGRIMKEDVLAWRGEPARGAVEIGIQFWMPGKSCRPPDLDKLQRAVLDALTGIVYVDDAQVVEIEAGKCGPSQSPGAKVWIRAEMDA